MRILLPDTPLVLSTREPAKLRDKLIHLGITVMSAGSKTEPGGYTNIEEAENQFKVCDDRTPEQIAAMLSRQGYDTVWKDWDRDFIK